MWGGGEEERGGGEGGDGELLGQRFRVGEERPHGHSDLVENIALGARVLAARTRLQMPQIGRNDRLQYRLQHQIKHPINIRHKTEAHSIRSSLSESMEWMEIATYE